MGRYFLNGVTVLATVIQRREMYPVRIVLSYFRKNVKLWILLVTMFIFYLLGGGSVCEEATLNAIRGMDGLLTRESLQGVESQTDKAKPWHAMNGLVFNPGNNATYVGTTSDLKTALIKELNKYDNAIELARNRSLKLYEKWQNEKIQVWPQMVISEWDPTFYHKMRQIDRIEIVIGYAAPSRHVNNKFIDNPLYILQREKYYVWSLDEFSCGRLVELYKDSHLFKGVCDKGHNYFGLGLRAIEATQKEHVEELIDYNAHHSRLHLAIIPYAYIEGDEFGYVYNHDVIVAQHACAEAWTPKAHEIFFNETANMGNWAFHDEVFVITQHWGRMYYHWTVDMLPKLVTHLDFLKRNTAIKILLNADQDVLERIIYPHFKIIGLDTRRIIQGKVKARLAYLPQGGGCVETFNTMAVQLTSNLFLNYIQSVMVSSEENPIILLIHRTSKRWLEQHEQIAGLLSRVAWERGLGFEIFGDKPPLSLERTQLLFHKAALIVGPHGAGFSNVMYSKPGTAVLEVLCGPPDAIQYSYPFLSYSLGLRHHGIGTVYGGCKGLLIHIPYLESMVYLYLDEMFKKSQ